MCCGRMPRTPTGTSSSATTTRSRGSRWPPGRDLIARRLAAPLFAAAAVAIATVAAAGLTAQPAASSRAVVVVSDLHFGEGRDGSGAWHPYEDFRWPAEFAGFLKTIDEDGKGSVDLILNGDTFELQKAGRQGVEQSSH